MMGVSDFQLENLQEELADSGRQRPVETTITTNT